MTSYILVIPTTFVNGFQWVGHMYHVGYVIGFTLVILSTFCQVHDWVLRCYYICHVCHFHCICHTWLFYNHRIALQLLVQNSVMTLQILDMLTPLKERERERERKNKCHQSKSSWSQYNNHVSIRGLESYWCSRHQ